MDANRLYSHDEQHAMQRLRNKLRGRQSLYVVSNFARQILVPTSYSSFLRFASLYEAINHDTIACPRITTDLNDWTPKPPYSPISPRSEVLWSLAVLKKYSSRIVDYIAWRSTLNASLNPLDLSSISIHLDPLLRVGGVSLLYIRYRLACVHYMDGFDAQKKFASSLRALPAGKNNLFSYIIYHMSQQAEVSVSHTRLIQDQFARIQKQTASDDIKNFLTFLLCPDHGSCSYSSLASILRFSSIFSPIDLYESFVASLPIIADLDSRLLRHTTARAVLCAFAQDPRIAYFFDNDMGARLFSLDVDSSINATSSSCHIVQSLLLRDRPSVAPTQLTEASSPISMAHAIDSVLHKMPNMDTATALLHWVCRNFCSLDAYTPIRLILFTDCHPHNSSAPSRFLSHTLAHGASQHILLYILLLVTLPASAELPTISLSIEDLPSPFDAADSVRVDALRRSLPSAYQDFLSLYLVAYHTRQSSMHKVMDDSMALDTSPLHYITTRNIYYSTLKALSDRLTDQPLTLLVSSIIHNPRLVHVVPLGVIYAIIESSHQYITGSLEHVVFIHLCSLHTPSVTALDVRIALSDLLDELSLSRPTDIIPSPPLVDNRILIYFFASVCTEEYLEAIDSMDSYRELQNERLAICRYLGEVDPENLDAYKGEIASILRIQRLTSLHEEVEASRIYVDTEGVARSCVPIIEDDYKRFAALISSDYQKQIEAAIKPTATPDDSSDISNIELPESEVSELVRKMINAVTDVYAGSRSYGLSWFLSVRVRHGAVENSLRGPLKIRHLILQRSDSSDDYMHDYCWTSGLEYNHMQSIEHALERFSAMYDGLIKELLDESFKVKRYASDKGKIVLAPTELVMSIVVDLWKKDYSVLEFAELLCNVCDLMLDHSLKLFRQEIDSHIRYRLLSIVDDLLNRIRSIGDAPRIQHIGNSILEARTDLQANLDRVREWFRRASLDPASPFYLRESIEVTEKDIRDSLHQEFRVEVREAVSLRLPGQFFLPITDIFQNLFTNVVRHSKLPRPCCVLSIDHELGTSDRNGFVLINCSNPVGADVNWSRVQATVQRYQRDIARESIDERVAKEGGTGLMKIFNIVFLLSRERPVMSIHCDESRTFEVRLKIPYTRSEDDEDSSRGG